jgi:hypothetical protein
LTSFVAAPSRAIEAEVTPREAGDGLIGRRTA